MNLQVNLYAAEQHKNSPIVNMETIANGPIQYYILKYSEYIYLHIMYIIHI